MRIISKFRDYYDTSMRYGMDQSLIYVRNEENIEDELEDILPTIKRFDYLTSEISSHIFMVGFCGNIHYGIDVRYHTSYPEMLEDIKKSIYNVEQFEDFVKSIKDKKLSNRLLKGKGKRRRWGSPSLTLENVKRFFEENPVKNYDPIFIKHNTPIIKVNDFRNPKVVKNASLKESEFYKVVDSYTAFQELSMYISGVLGVGEPETIDISDRDMMYKKGFNDISFKTLKGDKKPRKTNRGK